MVVLNVATKETVHRRATHVGLMVRLLPVTMTEKEKKISISRRRNFRTEDGVEKNIFQKLQFACVNILSGTQVEK